MAEELRPHCCTCGNYHQGKLTCKVLGMRYRRYHETGNARNPHICEDCIDRLVMLKELDDKYIPEEGK